FAILLGDSSFDPRNYLGLGSFDFVPTKLVATAYLKTASDDWFADFANSGIPSVAIGRIPVRTAAEANAVAAKLAARTSVPSASWARNVEIVEDVTADVPFHKSADQTATGIPAPYAVDRISFGTTPSPGAAVANAFSRGSLLTDYIGHGSVEI